MTWWRPDPAEPLTVEGLKRAMKRLLEAEDGYVLFVAPGGEAAAEEALRQLGWRPRVAIETTQALRQGDAVLIDTRMVAWDFTPEVERAVRRAREESDDVREG